MTQETNQEAPSVNAAQEAGTDETAELRRQQARERLAKAQEVMAEKRAAGWKPVQLNPVEKAKANPGSLKLAIRAHCWTCSGAGADPGTKFHVRDCKVHNCALWPHRPWQTAKGGLTMSEDGRLVVADGSEHDEAEGE